MAAPGVLDEASAVELSSLSDEDVSVTMYGVKVGAVTEYEGVPVPLGKTTGKVVVE